MLEIAEPVLKENKRRLLSGKERTRQVDRSMLVMRSMRNQIESNDYSSDYHKTKELYIDKMNKHPSSQALDTETGQKLIVVPSELEDTDLTHEV